MRRNKETSSSSLNIYKITNSEMGQTIGIRGALETSRILKLWIGEKLFECGSS